jgi:DNA modification methylase/Trp operon repressor
MINELKINTEIKNLIPSLSLQEYESLKASIKEEGCRDKIIIWNDTIIDGHNRYEICKEYGINFDTEEKEFNNEIEAKIWIINNQLGRRNITDFVKIELKQIEKELLLQQGKKTQGTRNDLLSIIDKKLQPHNTQKQIAKELNIGTNKLAQAEVIIKKATPEVKEQLRSGEVSINQVYKDIKKEERKERIEDIKERGKDIQLNSDIKLLEGDFFDKIKEVQDKSIDLLITDPPYSVMNDYDWDKKDLGFLDSWLKECKSKLKDNYNVFIFCDARMQYEFETIIKKYFDIKNRLIWIRKNMSMGRVVKDKFISSYEICFFAGNRELNFPENWGAERFDSFEFAVPQSNFKEGKYHPTQKPLELFKMLIELGSDEGNLVLDCFAGSGTSGIACKQLNRNCIMIEKEYDYINIIKGRIDELG